MLVKLLHFILQNFIDRLFEKGSCNTFLASSLDMIPSVFFSLAALSIGMAKCWPNPVQISGAS